MLNRNTEKIPTQAGAAHGAAPEHWGKPRLLVIIVNFRTPELVIQCLKSLDDEVPTVPGTRVVVVENGSGGDSAEQIARAIAEAGWNEWATLLRCTVNFGFAGGNNRGWEIAPTSDYALLLNSDTIVHPGCLAHCMETMQREPDIGAMSCLIRNADGSIQNVSRRFPTPIRLFARALGLPWQFPRIFEWADTDDLSWDRETTCRDVDWLGGAFLFIRGDVIRKIGLLDEDFFFYGEDIEFCHRVWRSGYRCHYQASPGSITHFGGSSTTFESMPSRKRIAQTFRARYLVQEKCYGRAARMFFRTLDLAIWSFRTFSRRLLEDADAANYLDAKRVIQTLLQRL